MLKEKHAASANVESPYVLRRVLHDSERRYLTCEAQGIAYRYIASEELPMKLIERAIQEAVTLGQLRNASVDGQLFEVLVEALLDDRSFEFPGSESEMISPSGSLVC